MRALGFKTRGNEKVLRIYGFEGGGVIDPTTGRAMGVHRATGALLSLRVREVRRARGPSRVTR